MHKLFASHNAVKAFLFVRKLNWLIIFCCVYDALYSCNVKQSTPAAFLTATVIRIPEGGESMEHSPLLLKVNSRHNVTAYCVESCENKNKSVFQTFTLYLIQHSQSYTS